MNKPIIEIASICTAFTFPCIGTRVWHDTLFFQALMPIVMNFDWSTCQEPGQAKIELEGNILTFIKSGVGRRTPDPAAYVCREHRGRVQAFLKRECSVPLTGATLILYTRNAYCSSPQVTPAEAKRVVDRGADYVIVALLGYAGPPSELSPVRFVENLAGGNKQFEKYTAHEIRHEAGHVIEYDRNWCVVAD